MKLDSRNRKIPSPLHQGAEFDPAPEAAVAASVSARLSNVSGPQQGLTFVLARIQSLTLSLLQFPMDAKHEIGI